MSTYIDFVASLDRTEQNVHGQYLGPRYSGPLGMLLLARSWITPWAIWAKGSWYRVRQRRASATGSNGIELNDAYPKCSSASRSAAVGVAGPSLTTWRRC